MHFVCVCVFPCVYIGVCDYVCTFRFHFLSYGVHVCVCVCGFSCLCAYVCAGVSLSEIVGDTSPQNVHTHTHAHTYTHTRSISHTHRRTHDILSPSGTAIRCGVSPCGGPCPSEDMASVPQCRSFCCNRNPLPCSSCWVGMSTKRQCSPLSCFWGSSAPHDCLRVCDRDRDCAASCVSGHHSRQQLTCFPAVPLSIDSLLVWCVPGHATKAAWTTFLWFSVPASVSLMPLLPLEWTGLCRCPPPLDSHPLCALPLS